MYLLAVNFYTAKKLKQNNVNCAYLMYLLAGSFYTAKNLMQTSVNSAYFVYILAVTFYTTKTEANKCKCVLFAIFACWNFLYSQNTESK